MTNFFIFVVTLVVGAMAMLMIAERQKRARNSAHSEGRKEAKGRRRSRKRSKR